VLLSPPPSSKPDTTNGLGARSSLDLDQFVAGLYTAKDVTAERGHLQQQGFRYAAETNWDAADGTGAEIFLIGFRTPAGAHAYADATTASAGESASTLAGVPGGTVLTATSADSYGDVIMSTRFAVDTIAVEIRYYSHARADIPGLTALAQAQYTRLAELPGR
jgi:hypothetical protein